jgi:hypothetical protein
LSGDTLTNKVQRHSPEASIELYAGTAEPWQDAEWQRLWLAVESRPWRSLALIPAGAGASPDFTLMIAMTLSRTGMVHLGSPVQVADATQVPLSQLTAFSNEVRRCTAEGQRLLIALPPPSKSAITASIAQSVDAAVLCVLAQHMSTAEANQTLRLVGRSRFLGSAVFHPSEVAWTR